MFGTFPVFLLLMLFLGFGVGIRNVIRISKTPPGCGPGAEFEEVTSEVAAAGKIDPMHQFTVEPLVPLHVGGYDISFTNSAAVDADRARRDLRCSWRGHEARSWFRAAGRWRSKA